MAFHWKASTGSAKKLPCCKYPASTVRDGTSQLLAQLAVTHRAGLRWPLLLPMPSCWLSSL
jgi:hypothetical protein